MNIYGYICKSEKPDFEFFVKMATDDMGRPVEQVTTLENGLVVIPVSIYQPPILHAQPAEPSYVAHEEAAEAHGVAGDYASLSFPTGTPEDIKKQFYEHAEQYAKHAIALSVSLGMLNLQSEMHDGYDHFTLRRRHMTIAQALKS
jgi:hypothetical protein